MPQGSKHPKAALYRHAWKRAAILGIIYQRRSDQALTTQFQEFEKLASKRYFEVAPDGLYGKARLVMGEKTGTRLLEVEEERLFPIKGKQPRIRPLACIYIGICEQGRVYVGQTVGPPESRWVQHRFGGTGPFKKGGRYIAWKVVEGGIDPAKLAEREFITSASTTPTKRVTTTPWGTIGELTSAAKQSAIGSPRPTG